MSEMFNQYQKSALAWEVLIKVAEDGGLIRYKSLGDQIGIHWRPVRYVLAKIQEFCLINRYPPITILVGDKKGKPGSGFTAWNRANIAEGLEEVHNYNWSTLKNPFSYALNGTTESDIIEELLNNPENSEETYGKIKVRGTAQIIFRKALLKAYNSRCAFCDFSFTFALQASHIIPWSKSFVDQRLDVRNGILLCANHHCLFDNGLLTIDDDYKIIYNSSKKHKVITNYDNLLSSVFHNKSMRLPRDLKHWPEQIYLHQHRKEFK